MNGFRRLLAAVLAAFGLLATPAPVFAAHQQLQEGLTKTLKAVTAKAAKWRKGELVTFKASE